MKEKKRKRKEIKKDSMAPFLPVIAHGTQHALLLLCSFLFSLHIRPLFYFSFRITVMHQKGELIKQRDGTTQSK